LARHAPLAAYAAPVVEGLQEHAFCVGEILLFTPGLNFLFTDRLTRDNASHLGIRGDGHSHQRVVRVTTTKSATTIITTAATATTSTTTTTHHYTPQHRVNPGAMKLRLYGYTVITVGASILLAARALKTPARNGYNA